MAHAENNEKKKDNKDVKKWRRIFPKWNISNAFAQKRDTKRNDKSRYTRDFQNIQKWFQEKGDEEKEKVMEIKKREKDRKSKRRK